MATVVSAPLPDLSWPTLTVIQVDAGDTNAVVESLIVLVAENAPELPDTTPVAPPLFAYEVPA